MDHIIADAVRKTIFYNAGRQDKSTLLQKRFGTIFVTRFLRADVEALLKAYLQRLEKCSQITFFTK